ncbi:MAG: hypothetical protein JNL48_07360 [Acidobacteria bacterium]|nr:hypothetical protein [Acidobacteriota bacterium]
MTTRDEMAARCNSIEEAYEFMLAYAAQGLASDQGTNSGAQVRQFLTGLDTALDGLGDVFRGVVAADSLAHADLYHGFIEVLDRDAASARAAVRLVLAQPGISSQMVDNLNASIHLRALLTDVFLVDEVLKTQVLAAKA